MSDDILGDLNPYLEDDYSGDDKHSAQRAAQLLLASIIWQAYMDLESPDKKQRWDAQCYFYDRDVFDSHAIELDWDPSAVRARLIKKQLLSSEPPQYQNLKGSR